jgi:hypothetical protein
MKATSALGFGFDPDESPYHFAVRIPRAATQPVVIEERFVWEDAAVPEGARAAAVKAHLDPYRWSRVADAARVQFNQRLRADGLRTAAWKVGETLLAPYLGKELTLLAWAVEDADPTVIPNMLANWLGLAPEERWWLYTTVNATGGHPEHGRERGWRKAIKIAFAENPAVSAPSFLAPPVPSGPPILPSARSARLKRGGRVNQEAETPAPQLSLLPEEQS